MYREEVRVVVVTVELSSLQVRKCSCLFVCRTVNLIQNVLHVTCASHVCAQRFCRTFLAPVSYRVALEVRAENHVDFCLIYCYLGTQNVAVINFMKIRRRFSSSCTHAEGRQERLQCAFCGGVKAVKSRDKPVAEPFACKFRTDM